MEPYRETQEFFKYALGRNEGYVCIATLAPGDRTTFREHYFEWPQDMLKMSDFCLQEARTLNVYFCPQLLNSRRRDKSNVSVCPNAWADLDTCDPSELRVKPSLLIESSPGRWQALWVFEDPIPPADAEAISRRIAYYHAHQGADRSGWDLTQLLRVPGTINYKYDFTPSVHLLSFVKTRFRADDLLRRYPAIKGSDTKEELPLPAPDKLANDTGEDLLAKYVRILPREADVLFEEVPETDWSKKLYNLEMLAFEAGMSREECFVVARDASCNKYRRDNPDDHDKADALLWREVCKAWVRREEALTVTVPEDWEMPDLLTPSERRLIDGRRTFVEDYINWAKSVGDAAPQYHEAGGFIALSSLLSGSLTLRTSYGEIKPNLWFMILGDTTLTRKSTAMSLAMGLVKKIDPDIELANDGSLEGLQTAISTRPGQPSLFVRDEFAGLLEAMTKKDYLAGLYQFFCEVYDCRSTKRQLKKEIIDIQDPIFIMFAGGIKSKITSLLTEEHFTSGFAPRFVFITAEADINGRKSMRPATVATDEQRNALATQLRKIRAHYKAVKSNQAIIDPVTKRIVMPPERLPVWEVLMPDEVWDRYDKLEREMVRVAEGNLSMKTILTPSYERLAKSTLKAAVLIAASEMRRPPEEGVVVEMEDMLAAIRYLEGWRLHTNIVLKESGKSVDEQLLTRIYQNITREPNITRGKLSQNFHLSKYNAARFLETLEDRHMIVGTKSGNGFRYTAVRIKRPLPTDNSTERITVQMPEEVS